MARHGRGRGHGSYYGAYSNQPMLPAPADGIKLRTRSGQTVGRCAAARELAANLERSFDSKRREKGLTMARAGRICRLSVADDGSVSARAVGTEHYEMTLSLPRFKASLHADLLSELEDSSGLARALALGKLPDELDDAVIELSGGTERLAPKSFKATCSCPYGSRCKHLAALCYVLAQAVDDDPSLALVLRGIARDELLGALSGAGVPEPRSLKTVSVAEFFSEPAFARISIPAAHPDDVLSKLSQAPEDVLAEDAHAATEMLRVILKAAASWA